MPKPYVPALDELPAKQELAEALQAAIDDAASTYNDAIAAAWSAFKEEVEKYNAGIADLNLYVDEVCNQLQERYDDRSETWQEGPKGDALQDMISEWEQFSGFEPTEPSKCDEPDSITDVIGNYPTEPAE